MADITRSESVRAGSGRSFLTRHRAYRDAGELLLVAMAFLLYFVVRANVIDRPAEALSHAHTVIRIEKSLGIFDEPSWQAAIVDHRLPVKFFNFVYFWLDFPLIASVGLLLYFRRRTDYTFTRDAILASGALALISYNLFPVAPPRLVPGIGVVDTLQVFNNLSYQAQSTQFFVNPYAAMPSLHVGWAILLAVGVARAYGSSRWVLGLAVLHPVVQATSTVMTGNHFFLDGGAGLVAAGFGLTVAYVMEGWGYDWLRERLGGSG